MENASSGVRHGRRQVVQSPVVDVQVGEGALGVSGGLHLLLVVVEA